MSGEFSSTVSTGRFSSSRGPMGAEDMAFVADCMKRRVPTAHIARMANRPFAEVRRIQDLLIEAAKMPAEPARASRPEAVEIFISPRWMEIQVRNNVALTRSIEHIATRWRVSPSDIFSEDRRRSTVFARQELMHHLRNGLGWKFPRIGKFMCRDHSTCVWGVQAHAQRLFEKCEAA